MWLFLLRSLDKLQGPLHLSVWLEICMNVSWKVSMWKHSADRHLSHQCYNGTQTHSYFLPRKIAVKTSQTSVVPTYLRKEVPAALGWKWEDETRARESQSTGGLQSLTWEAHRARARAQAQCLSPRSEQDKSLRAVGKQNPRAKVPWRWGQSWNLLENWYKWLGYLWRTKVSCILTYQGCIHPPFTCLIHCSPASDPPY